MSSPLFFMHIPKTAGTSLRYLLEREYRPHLGVYYPPHVPDSLPSDTEYQAVTGHFKWGFHGTQPARYVTFLREPLKQLVSHYRHIQRSNHPDHQPYKDLGWVAFAQTPFASNIQTAYLLGLADGSTLTAADGERAFARLMSFEAFGITEQFDASIVMMWSALGWRRPLYLTINQGEGAQPTLDAELIQALQATQPADQRLYALALQAFESRWKEVAHSGLKLRLYRLLNAGYTQLTPWLVRAKQALK
jgi:hypothetical protein